MTRDRAAYMRDYRAKRRTQVTEGAESIRPTPFNQNFDVGPTFAEVTAERDRLTEEVARLKRDLAARPAVAQFGMGGGHPVDPSFTEFRPVPKPGKGK